MLTTENQRTLIIITLVALVLLAIYYVMRVAHVAKKTEGYAYTYPYDFLEPVRRFCGSQQRLFVPYTDEEVFVRYH